MIKCRAPQPLPHYLSPEQQALLIASLQTAKAIRRDLRAKQPTALMRRYHLSRSAFYARHRWKSRRLTAEQIREIDRTLVERDILRRIIAEGFTHPRIAKMVGCSKQTVIRYSVLINEGGQFPLTNHQEKEASHESI